jgi:molybdopterin synthase sulfur carrier subunit
MKVRVRYFASLREALGAEELVEVGEGANVGQLRDALVARSPAHAGVLARGRAVRCSVDRVMCDDGELLRAQSEVAFFPPVTGG